MVKQYIFSIAVLSYGLLLASQSVDASQSESFVEDSVKSRINARPGPRCISVELSKESENQYKGTIHFEDGRVLGIAATVRGQEVIYQFKTGKDISASRPLESSTENNYSNSEPNSLTSNASENEEQIDPATIKTLIIIGLIIIISIIAVSATYSGKAIFFSSYLDWFTSIIPLLILMFLLYCAANSYDPAENTETIDNTDTYSEYLMLGLGAWVILYNLIKSFIDNRENKFLAFCVAVGRIVIGNIIPMIIILNLFFSGREKGESRTAYELRKTRNLIFAGAFMLFLHTLIGRERYEERKMLGVHNYNTRLIPDRSEFSSYNPRKHIEGQAEQSRENVRIHKSQTCSDPRLDLWLCSLESQGEVAYTYYDPYDNSKHSVSKRQFIRQVQDFEMIKQLGEWSVQEVDQTNCIFSREFFKGDTCYTEKYVISVKQQIKNNRKI